MCAGWVKVAQQCSIPLLSVLSLLFRVVPLRVDVVGDQSLDCNLGVAVWVGGSERAVFWDGDHVLEAGRIAINCCRGREDDVGDIMAGHGAEESDGTTNVDTVVLDRNFARLANSLQCQLALRFLDEEGPRPYLQGGEVYDAVDVWVRIEDLVERSFVGDVGLVVLWALTRDQLKTVDAFFRGVVEVVDDHHLVVGFEELESGEGANVASTAA